MRVIYKIAKSELGTLFYSPIAWLILVIFVFQVFGSFANLLEYTVNAKTLGQMRDTRVICFRDWWFRPLHDHPIYPLSLHSPVDNGAYEPGIQQWFY